MHLQLDLVDEPVAADLLADWTRCYRATPSATPFSSPTWVRSWWRHYAPGRGVLLTVRSAGRVVAVLPLARGRGTGARVLRPAAVDLSDYHDVLVDGLPEQAWPEVGTALRRVPGWDAVDLRQLRPHSPLLRLAGAWRAAGALVADDAPSCLLPLDGASGADEVAARTSRSLAKRVRVTRRRAEAAQVRREVLPATPEAVQQVLDSHLAVWQDRPLNPEHAAPRFAAHLREALPALAEEGEAVLDRLLLDGEELVARVNLRRGPWLGAWLEAQHRPELGSHLQLPVLTTAELLDAAPAQGVEVVDLLRGLYPPKLRWGPVVLPTHRLVLARTARGRLHLEGVRLRSAAASDPRVRRVLRRPPRPDARRDAPDDAA